MCVKVNVYVCICEGEKETENERMKIDAYLDVLNNVVYDIYRNNVTLTQKKGFLVIREVEDVTRDKFIQHTLISLQYK